MVEAAVIELKYTLEIKQVIEDYDRAFTAETLKLRRPSTYGVRRGSKSLQTLRT